MYAFKFDRKFKDVKKQGKEQKLHRIRGKPSFAPNSIDPGTNFNSDVSSFVIKALESLPTKGGIYLWRDAKGRDEFDYKYTVMELKSDGPKYTNTSKDRSHDVPKRISIVRIS